MAENPRDRPGLPIARMVAARGISDARVLEALAQVPRERFVPPPARRHAAEDRALAIGEGQTISQPYIVGFMSQELALTGSERVLEIGTGSGYQTAVLAFLARDVFTVERIPLLSLRARAALDGLGIENTRFRVGDGSFGWPDDAPFDRIVVTCAVPAFPSALFAQLAEGGRLLAPIGGEQAQELTVIEKRAGLAVERRVLACRFVPLVGESGWAPGQVSE
jgi:protein-L-isoaspartate(D-aspartate) O-methyltransferase